MKKKLLEERRALNVALRAGVRLLAAETPELVEGSCLVTAEPPDFLPDYSSGHERDDCGRHRCRWPDGGDRVPRGRGR